MGARKVTQEDILLFNQLYYRFHNYSQVARETGWSASTVSKYIDKNWEPVEEKNTIKFTLSDLPVFSTLQFKDLNNYGELCELSPIEEEEIKELWKELSI